MKTFLNCLRTKILVSFDVKEYVVIDDDYEAVDIFTEYRVVPWWHLTFLCFKRNATVIGAVGSLPDEF